MTPHETGAYTPRDAATAHLRPPGADPGRAQRRLPPGLPGPAVPVPEHRPRPDRPSHRVLRPRRARRRADHLSDPPVPTRPARRRGGHRHHQSRDLGPSPHVHPRRPLGLARHRARLPRPPAAISAQWRPLAEQATRQRQAPADYLAQLAHLEVTGRQERRIQRRMQEARFPMLKTLDAFSFDAQPDLGRRIPPARASSSTPNTSPSAPTCPPRGRTSSTSPTTPAGARTRSSASPGTNLTRPAASSGSRPRARRRWWGGFSRSHNRLPRPWRADGHAATPTARWSSTATASPSAKCIP